MVQDISNGIRIKERIGNNISWNVWIKQLSGDGEDFFKKNPEFRLMSPQRTFIKLNPTYAKNASGQYTGKVFFEWKRSQQRAIGDYQLVFTTSHSTVSGDGGSDSGGGSGGGNGGGNGGGSGDYVEDYISASANRIKIDDLPEYFYIHSTREWSAEVVNTETMRASTMSMRNATNDTSSNSSSSSVSSYGVTIDAKSFITLYASTDDIDFDYTTQSAKPFDIALDIEQRRFYVSWKVHHDNNEGYIDDDE